MTEVQRLASLRNAFDSVPGYSGHISINRETGEPEFTEHDYTTMPREMYDILKKRNPEPIGVLGKIAGRLHAKVAEMRQL